MYIKLNDENLRNYKEFAYNYKMKFTCSEGLYLVKNKSGKYGYIDEDENVQVPCMFDDAYYFENGKSRVKLDDEVFFINKEGRRTKAPKIYKNTKLIQTELLCKAYFSKDLPCCIIDAEKYEIIPGDINSLILIKNSEGLFGYMDFEAKIVIPCMFNLATPFIDGQALVYYDKKWLYINPQGEFKISKDNKIELEKQKVY